MRDTNHVRMNFERSKVADPEKSLFKTKKIMHMLFIWKGEKRKKKRRGLGGGVFNVN